MIPQLDQALGAARVWTAGDCLHVATGAICRVWRWTGHGFATVGLTGASTRQWVSRPGTVADWQLPDGQAPGPAELRSLTVAESNDEGFTSPHLAVTAEIACPEQRQTLRWSVWAYPDAPGLRTQLAARLDAPPDAPKPGRPQGAPDDALCESLPVTEPSCRRRFFGYFNQTQQRNDTHQHLLEEQVVAHPLSGREWCSWASVACLEDDEGGVALVKESHKCPNQPGHATGGFVVDEHAGLWCTGWGLRPDELSDTQFTAGWATWTIAWTGAHRAREVACKRFDRLRFPLDPARDIYVQANTWGSTDNSRDARRAATAAQVLPELEACADLGIEVLQIDDGWQVPPGDASWDPGERGWHPHPESHPNGWEPVRRRAAELGLRLGLWAAAEPIGEQELLANQQAGGFTQFKLDFANLRSRAQLDCLMGKVRRFIAATGHRVRVNWDVTEIEPRYGYFYAREYGCIYLENRKPERPRSVVYRPHTVLRDLWEVSRYLNLHRFQGSIQNVDLVNPDWSDAHRHSHAYAVAVALMSTPLFFQQTQLYTAAARAEIRDLLALYKEHRQALYEGLVHPLGQCPDNASWTGFQCELPHPADGGYLLLFRERCNPSPEASLALVGLGPGTFTFTDLGRGDTERQKVTAQGVARFRLPDAPDFRFLRYTPS